MKKAMAAVLILATGCRGLDRLTGGPPHHGTGGPMAQAIVVGAGQSNMTYFSPSGEQAFKRVLRSHGREVAFINCAVGGSALHEWEPDGALFHSCVEQVTTYQKAYGGRVVALIWQQGETDANGSNWCHVEDYAQVFTGYIWRYREAFGDINLPVVFSQIGRHTDAGRPEWEAIKNQQASVVLKNAAMIRADSLPLRWDGIHYTEEGYIEHGEAFARALLKIFLDINK